LTYAGRVWLASALYAVVYFALGTDRYATYHSGADLGLFTQTIASSFHGFSNTVEGGSHFTFHFSPILYLCAPLLWLARSPLALVAIQAVAVALAAPPLFLLARRRVPEPLAAGVAAIALLYPPLAGIAFSDFHENGFAPAATLWLLWAVDGRRWSAAAAFLALCLAIKEDQAPILAFAAAFGAVYFMRRRERAGTIFCMTAFAACTAVFASFFAIVRPLAGATNAWTPLHFYQAGLATPGAGGLSSALFGRFTYLLEAFVPLCFASFASPAILLAIPGFAELFLSRESVTYTMGQHYAAIWIGFVLAAFALGIARIYRRSPRAAANVVRASAALCTLVLIFASPTHWAHYVGLRTAHHRALDRTLASLPPRIVVGTHDELFAHLGMDPYASLGLRYSPDYALFDWTMRTSYWVERTRASLADSRGSYALVREADGIALYARRSSGGRR
jgi:uncharacterized membrane protein